MLTLLALRSMAQAMDEDTRQMACVAAVARHIVVWTSCGCNPLTLPLHIVALATVYGEDE